MAYKMHLPLGTGYLRGVCISTIQPECQCLNHSGFHPMWGGGHFHPQKIKLYMYIVQIPIEKALIECHNQP